MSGCGILGAAIGDGRMPDVGIATQIRDELVEGITSQTGREADENEEDGKIPEDGRVPRNWLRFEKSPSRVYRHWRWGATSNSRIKIPYYFRWAMISAAAGVLAGSASALFLISLEWVTSLRESHPWLISFLPLGGLAVGLAYFWGGKSVESGNNLLIDEVHDPKKTVPFRMTPLVLLGTLLTHVFGGSAGREGTAIQMGGSIADQLSQPLKLFPGERRTLLMAGMAGGFGSVFGVPLAGAVFGLEVLAIGRLHLWAIVECLLASYVAHFTTLAWGVRHTHYAAPLLPDVNFVTLISLALAGVCFGLCARGFSFLTHEVQAVFKRVSAYPPFRPLVGGIIIVLGYKLVGSDRYAGLGVPVIEASLREAVLPYDFALKTLFTSLTLGAGLKGGEVTPLLFIGATLGNALAWLLPVGFSILAATGFVAVFAGAANTPIACTVMAMEIFGPGIGFFAAIACYTSYLVSGHEGIYHAQRIAVHKAYYWRRWWDYFISLYSKG